MDKDIAEIYTSPYAIEFYGNSDTNILRNTKSMFLFRDHGHESCALNTGDIFLTAINYLEEYNDLEGMLDVIEQQINALEKKINSAISEIKYMSDKNMRFLTNENTKMLTQFAKNMRVLELRHSLLYSAKCFIDGDIEIVRGIKEMIDTFMCDVNQITTQEFPEYATEFYTFLKNAQVIIGYNGKGRKAYYFYGIDDILVFDMQEFFGGEYILKKCESCGKYFVPVNRKDEKYCYYFDGIHTCREIGYQKKVESDEIQKTYRNIYKTQNARKQRNKKNISGIEANFCTWSDYAKEQLNLCKFGIISLDEMVGRISGDEWIKGGAYGNDPEKR